MVRPRVPEVPVKDAAARKPPAGLRPGLVVLGLAGVLWATLLVPGLVNRVSVLVRESPNISLSADKVAEAQSGNAGYHAFLGRVGAAFPAAADILFLSGGQGQDDLFLFYRACYELYPSRIWYVPVPAAPPKGRTLTLAVDSSIANLVSARSVRAAAYASKDDFSAGGAYSLMLTKAGKLKFDLVAPPAGPVPSPAGPSRRWGWPLALCFVVAAGFLVNSLTGFGRGFRGDIPGAASAALFTGAGFLALEMIAFWYLGISWRPRLLAAPWLLGAAAWGWRWYNRPKDPAEAAWCPEPGLWPLPGWVAAAGVALIVLSAAINLLAVAIPISAWSNWDTWAIWNLKVRAFTHAGGIPKEFLGLKLYDFSHPDYPPLLPLLQTFLTYCAGGMDERLLRLTSAVFHLGLVLLCASLAGELGLGRARWLVGALVGLLPKFLEQASSGYADLLVAGALVSCGLAFIRTVRGKQAAWTIGFAGGIAALVKNEGLLFTGGLMLALLVLVAFRRLRWQSWVFAGIIFAALGGPWNVMTRAYGWPGTLTGLRGVEPFETGKWLSRLRDSWLFLWYAVILGLAAGAVRLAKPEFWGVWGAILIQLAVVGSVYVASQYQMVWLLVTSLDRIFLQVSPLAFTLACGMGIPSLVGTHSPSSAKSSDGR
jgi:hypothetical protein